MFFILGRPIQPPLYYPSQQLAPKPFVASFVEAPFVCFGEVVEGVEAIEAAEALARDVVVAAWMFFCLVLDVLRCC